MSKKELKFKRCRNEKCGKEFVPRVSTQIACSPLCAVQLINTRKEKKHDKLQLEQQKIERQADKEKREQLKSRKSWLSDAQAVFNKYIRMRDEQQPCISCGRIQATWDAGHYRSTAAAPQLRFDELNVHKQCVHCNQHKSGNAIEYRIGLVKRIGAEAVEQLENNNAVRKWTIDDAKEIKETYRQKIKEMNDKKSRIH